MTQYLIFAGLFLILHGLHDAFVIEGRKVINSGFDGWWHGVQVIKEMLMILFIILIWGLPLWIGVQYFVLYFVMRAWLFNLSLNCFRIVLGSDIPLFHLGKSGIEGWFVKHKVSWLYWLSALVLTIILIVI